MKIHSDFSDFIHSLNHNNVEYVMVGAFNLAFLGFPRFTGDMDIWIRPTSQFRRREAETWRRRENVFRFLCVSPSEAEKR